MQIEHTTCPLWYGVQTCDECLRAEVARLTAERDRAQELAKWECAARHDYYAHCDKIEAECERLRAALAGLLREMTLDHSLPSYEVYQVTHGAVADARKALAGHNPQHSTVSA